MLNNSEISTKCSESFSLQTQNLMIGPRNRERPIIRPQNAFMSNFLAILHRTFQPWSIMNQMLNQQQERRQIQLALNYESELMKKFFKAPTSEEQAPHFLLNRGTDFRQICKHIYRKFKQKLVNITKQLCLTARNLLFQVEMKKEWLLPFQVWMKQTRMQLIKMVLIEIGKEFPLQESPNEKRIKNILQNQYQSIKKQLKIGEEQEQRSFLGSHMRQSNLPKERQRQQLEHHRIMEEYGDNRRIMNEYQEERINIGINQNRELREKLEIYQRKEAQLKKELELKNQLLKMTKHFMDQKGIQRSQKINGYYFRIIQNTLIQLQNEASINKRPSNNQRKQQVNWKIKELLLFRTMILQLKAMAFPDYEDPLPPIPQLIQGRNQETMITAMQRQIQRAIKEYIHWIFWIRETLRKNQ